MKNEKEIIESLKKGIDVDLRMAMSAEIKKVLEKSDNGEIGYAPFIGDIEIILNKGWSLAKNNYKE
jgi:hypothetical protein